MEKTLKVVGINGSIREDSYNQKLLNTAVSFLPEGIDYTFADYPRHLPLFSEDTETPLPEKVKAFKQVVEKADVLLFATPQYNNSIPGVLKNAIDWLTRPFGSNSLKGKIAGIMGATPGLNGTVNAQNHLRDILSALDVLLLPRPMLLVTAIHNMIDEEGNLKLDGAGEQTLQNHVDRLVELASKHA